MKQFQYTDGYRTYGPYTLDDVEALFPRHLAVVQTVRVGDSVLDKGVERVTWTRLPDVLNPEIERVSADGMHIEPHPPIDIGVRAERLERIATYVFASMVNASPMLSDAVLARTAVDFAKALIAELDKQS